MQLRAGVVVVGWLVATTAHADLLGPGQKSVKLTMQVEATVPDGKALVLDNTFRGADVVVPNAVTAVEWHPLGGDMQFKVVGKDRLGELPALREALDRPAIDRILEKAVVCGAPFPGVRTISDSSPAAEVRWLYRVTIAGDTCSAEQVRVEYLDADGKPVAAPGDAAAPRAPDVKTEVKTETTIETKAADSKASPAKAPEASGCNLAGAPAAPLGLGVVVLGLLARRRR